MKVIDISMMVDTGFDMHTPAGVKNVGLSLEVIKDHDSAEGAGQLVRAITARLHSGTHVDAPEHAVKGGKQTHDIPVETFVGPAVVANMSHKSPGGAITVEDLEKDIGSLLKEGDRMLVRTDWNDQYGKPNYEQDSPYLSVEALQWCVDKKLKIVGFDFAHIKDDPKSPQQYYTTFHLLGNNVLTLVRLTNLRSISKKRVTLICLPLPIKGCEASLCRAVVLED